MKTRVLFLCTGNSARSQMAEGLLRHSHGDLFEVASAGTRPRGVHSLAIETMAEQVIDISQQESTPAHHFEGSTTSLPCVIGPERRVRMFKPFLR